MKRKRLKRPTLLFFRILILPLLIISLICGTGFPFFVVEAQAARVSRQYGDVNWDGQVDSRDVLLINQHIAASQVEKIKSAHSDWILFGDDYEVADVNNDGCIDSRDQLRVIEYNSAATVQEIRNKHPEWYNFLRRYYEYNATLKASTTKVKLDLNGVKSCKISVTRKYGRHCYLTFKPIEKKPSAKIELNGWDSAKETYTFTLIGNTVESFSFRVNLYDQNKRTLITSSEVISVNVVKKNAAKSSKANELAVKAEAEVGYQGRNSKGTGKGDYTKYGKLTKSDGQPWCAAFVSWCVNKTGVSTSVVPRTAYTLDMGRKSNSYRKWSSSNYNKLKRGDVIFFSHTKALTYKGGKKAVYHVGIVTSVDRKKGTITIVEGNTSKDIVKKNTYKPSLSSGYLWKNAYFCGYISVK